MPAPPPALSADAMVVSNDALILMGLGVVFAALTLVEMRRPLMKQAAGSDRRLLANFGLGVLNLMMSAVIPLTTVATAELARRNGWGLLNLVAAPAWIAVPATVAAASLAQYAIHRLAHHWSLLWRLHRVHHCDTAVDLSTTLRSHPAELLVVIPWIGVVAAAMGLSPVTLAAYQVVALGFGLLGHANIALPDRLDGWLRRLLVTPSMHHVHHSVDQSETDSNYGEVFSVWDHLFGTHVRRDAAYLADMRRGLGPDMDEGADRLLTQVLLPLRGARPAVTPQSVGTPPA